MRSCLTKGRPAGSGKIAFPDWRPLFDAFAGVPNVDVFRQQADALAALLQEAPLTPEQISGDLDFQQSLSQLFTLIPYAQLILEQAQLDETPQDIVDLVFETLVRDFQLDCDRVAWQGLIDRCAASVGGGQHTQTGDQC